VLLHVVYFLICQWLGRAVPISCAALLLLLATRTITSANSLQPLGNGPLLAEATLSSFPASDGTVAKDINMCAGNRESLPVKPTFAVSSSSHVGTVSTPSLETAAGEAQRVTAFQGKEAPDWDGVWRDTGILFGSQIVAAGLIYLMPESVSGWSDEQKKDSFKKYGKNVGHPSMDEDKFYVNYLLHPYWGATYYIRGRERGLDKVPCFVYSALISAMYEFGVEAFFEKPSIQDLIVTPVAGSLLGAFVFEPVRDSIKRKQVLRWYDDAVLIVTDPVGVLSSAVEKLFGIESTVRLQYSAPQLQKLSPGSAIASKNNRIGISLQIPLD
jgi:hypothetical protein